MMDATGNLKFFLSEPKWIFLTIYGFVSGISVIFIFRRVQNSLTRIRHLIGSEEKFLKVKDKLLGYLTHKVSWIFITFWPVMNIGRLFMPTDRINWWWFYNQPFYSTVYYYIDGIFTWIFGGLFFYMIPFGLTLVYRELCLKTSFKEELLSSEWMEPFLSFRSLITLTMFIAVINALLGIIIWAPTMELTPFIFFPYASMIIILVPTILFPHYFFYKLFSRTKQRCLKELQKKITKIENSEKNDKISEILLLLRKNEVEKMKTWLFDMKILGEVIIVALMHVILIEALTTIMHG
jgi:hypothetical protein